MSDPSMQSGRMEALATLAAGAAVLVVGMATRGQLPWARPTAKWIGLVVLYSGMALVLWAALHLRSAIMGRVAPVLDRLIVGGPYRRLRHPVYLGMTIAMIGAMVALRSGYGLLAVALLFLPVEVARARREEEALEWRFGTRWQDYVAEAGFLLPRFRRRGSKAGGTAGGGSNGVDTLP